MSNPTIVCKRGNTLMHIDKNTRALSESESVCASVHQREKEEKREKERGRKCMCWGGKDAQNANITGETERERKCTSWKGGEIQETKYRRNIRKFWKNVNE